MAGLFKEINTFFVVVFVLFKQRKKYDIFDTINTTDFLLFCCGTTFVSTTMTQFPYKFEQKLFIDGEFTCCSVKTHVHLNQNAISILDNIAYNTKLI